MLFFLSAQSFIFESRKTNPKAADMLINGTMGTLSRAFPMTPVIKEKYKTIIISKMANLSFLSSRIKLPAKARR